MIRCWISKTFHRKSSKTSYIKRKPYDQQVKEGRDMDGHNISRMCWKDFSLVDEARIDYKEMMMNAIGKTKMVVKASKPTKLKKNGGPSRQCTSLKVTGTGKQEDKRRLSHTAGVFNPPEVNEIVGES